MSSRIAFPVVVTVALAALVLPSRGSGAESAPSPQPAPSIAAPTTIAPVHVSDARVVASLPYSTGPVKIEVEIANGADAPSGKVSVTFTRVAHDGSGLKQSFAAVEQITPKGRTTIGFDDPEGMDLGCQPRAYYVQLAGGAQVLSAKRSIWVTPTCKFTTKIVDQLNTVSDDRATDWTKDQLVMGPAQLGAAYECGKDMDISVAVLNHTTKTANDVVVEYFDPLKRPLSKASLDIASGGKGTARMHRYPTGRSGAGLFVLSDPKGSVGGKVYSQQLNLHVTRACSLAV